MTDENDTPEREIPPGPFVKVYGSIVYSSVWRESKDTRLLWITMLALADEKGYVRASIGGLADLAKISREECVASLEVLKAPDLDSRDKSNDGRRIVELQGGWRILNKERYRDMRTPSAAATPDEKYSPSYVYYAVCGGHCKIGVSKNPWARVADMKTVRPEIRVAVVEGGDQELERKRHAQFADAHIDREWFLLTPELQAHIDQLLVLRSKARRTTVAPVARPECYEETEIEVEVDSKAVVVVDSTAEPTSPQFPTAQRPPKPGDSITRFAIYYTTALNRGLKDNPAIGEQYNPVVASYGANHAAAEKLVEAGIDSTFAYATIYALAQTYKPRKPGDQIGSLSYLALSVATKWEQEQARRAAEAAPRPETPAQPSAGNGDRVRPANGRRDLKGEGLIIFGKLKAAVRERIVYDNPDSPSDGGNRLERSVDPDEIAQLSGPAHVALQAVGGPNKLARSDDATLGWKFAAAYAAAAGAGQ